MAATLVYACVRCSPQCQQIFAYLFSYIFCSIALQFSFSFVYFPSSMTLCEREWAALHYECLCLQNAAEHRSKQNLEENLFQNANCFRYRRSANIEIRKKSMTFYMHSLPSLFILLRQPPSQPDSAFCTLKCIQMIFRRVHKFVLCFARLPSFTWHKLLMEQVKANVRYETEKLERTEMIQQIVLHSQCMHHRELKKNRFTSKLGLLQ